MGPGALGLSEISPREKKGANIRLPERLWAPGIKSRTFCSEKFCFTYYLNKLKPICYKAYKASK